MSIARREVAVPHRVIRASAGTGKTFTLSSRYLKLLMRGARPQQILATTFTRKAADEILSRVLLRVARGARDEAGARELAAQLRLEDVDLVKTRSALMQLVSSLHVVSISTIDSFFNRIAQSFQFELDLPADAIIVAADDARAVQLRLEAIEAMLADDDPHVLVDLLRRLHHDKAQRSVTEAIESIVKDLHDVYRLAPQAEVWSALKPPQNLLSPAQLADAVRTLEDVVTMLSTRWITRHRDAAIKLMESARRNDWESIVSNGLAKAVTTGNGTYCSKPVADELARAVAPVARHAAATIVGQITHRARAMHDLLRRFDEHFTRLRRERRVQLFSDLPVKLGGALLRGDETSAEVLQDICYRLDGRVQHLLLDEFQDTSIEQWQVLLPFAQEICAHGDESFSRTFFCVGDLKQAIYNWRGGCAQLFAQVERDLHLDDSARASLNHSFRSSQIVLDVVNRVFERLADAVPVCDHVETVLAWQEGFQQHIAARDLPGYVELRTSPAPPEKNDTPEVYQEEVETPGDSHLSYVADRVAAIAAEAPGRSIGVIVRTNDTVNKLIYHLRRRSQPVSGEGGNLVTDDPAVNVVLSALTLADHPGHSAAVFHVLTSPMAPIIGLTSMEEAHVADIARNIRRQLMLHGYAALLSQWVRALAPSCDRRGVMRLMQLVELADRYDPAITLRTRDFIKFVRSTPVEEPTSASIRVMTVHKSKGLEFDVVVLPQLDTLLGQVREDVWCYREDPTQPPDAIFAASNQTIREIVSRDNPTYLEAYEQEVQARLQDDLCGFYVAMTRARYALHMIVPPIRRTKTGISTKGTTNLCCASILRDRLEVSGEGFAGDEVLFSHGDPRWYEKLPRPVEQPSVSAQPSERRPSVRLAPAESRTRRSWPRISPSSLQHQGRISAAELLAIDTHAGRQRGSAMHHLFEQIGWLDDGVPDDATLMQALRESDMRAEDAWLAEQLQQFRQMLELPGVREALVRPTTAAGATCELWRERPFAVHLDNRLLRGTFDRVIVTREGNRTVHARLIDFKTDRIDTPEAIAAAVDIYRPQIDAYRRALQTMLQLPADRVQAQLLFLETGQLVTC